MKRALLAVIALTAILQSSPSNAQNMCFDGMAALAGGCNTTWGCYGGVDLRARMGVGDYLDLNADFEGLTSNVFAAGLSARPKIKFDKGTMYIDAGMLYKLSGGDGIFDFVSAGSLGWQMKHIEVQLGLYSRTLGSLTRDKHSLEDRIGEPFNILYRGQLNLKGDDSDWDLWAGASDFTPYEYERHWSPIFFLGGRKDLNENLTLFGQAEIKPTGMFHLNANFYGVVCRVGAYYSF